MKKYITFVALLTAGSTFANADTATWDFEKSGFYLEGKEVFASGDFTLSFTFDATALGSTENLELFKISADTTSFAFNTNAYSGNTAKISLNDLEGITGTWATGGDFTSARMNSSTEGAQNTLSFTFWNDGTVLYIGDSYVFSDGGKGSNEKRWKFSGRTLSSHTWDTLVLADGLNNMSVTLTANTLNAVPEPSAFSLIAGLSALALVGARRRRK